MELDLTEVADVLGILDAFGRKVESAMEAGLMAAGKVVQSEARRRAPNNKIRTRIFSDKKIQRQRGGLFLMVRTKSPLGHLFELGTGMYGRKGHRIYPKWKKFMKFKDPRTGKMMFIKSSPGIKAKPYMKPALDNTIGAQLRCYQDAYNEKIK